MTSVMRKTHIPREEASFCCSAVLNCSRRASDSDRNRAVDGVGRERAAEEHDLGNEEDPHPQRGSVLLLLRGVELLAQGERFHVRFANQPEPPGRPWRCNRKPRG